MLERQLELFPELKKAYTLAEYMYKESCFHQTGTVKYPFSIAPDDVKEFWIKLAAGVQDMIRKD